MELISVIVPVYGVEQYLRECLDSILAQTYREFELILVDDGSPDRCGEICDGYAKKDPRVYSYHKENGGLSSARNYGIEHSKGRYLCFIDSDDWIERDYLQTLYEGLVVSNADICICDMKAEKIGNYEHEIQEGLLTREEILWWLEYPIAREYVLAVVAVNKLYKRAIFEDIRYPLGKLHEDEFVAYPLLEKADKIYFVKRPLYIYRERTESITGGQNVLDSRHLDVIEAYEHRMEGMAAKGESCFLEFTWRNILLKTAEYYRIFSREQPEVGKKVRQSYRRIYKKYQNSVSFKKKLKYGLFCVCPKLFCSICLK